MVEAIFQNRTAQAIACGKYPPSSEGPKAAQYLFDFSLAPTITLNTSYADMGMSLVQTVFIDNSNNPSSFELFVYSSQQKLYVAPYTQALFPVLMIGSGSVSVIGSSAGQVPVQVQFLNIPQPVFNWNSRTPDFTGAVRVIGTVTVQSDSGVYTDHSSAVQEGGVSQTGVAANGARKRLFIANPQTATSQNIATAESLWVNWTSPAAVNSPSSIELTPGASLDTGIGPVSTELVTVTAATTGHQYTIKELN